MEDKKCNISVRISTSDKSRVSEISSRLQVKDSELLRFAINTMLNKLMPLSDSALKGADLIPVWLECGEELLQYFHIDIEKLDSLFNDGLDLDERPVDHSDLNLILLSGLNSKYVVKKLSEISKTKVLHEDAPSVLRNYLYEKYVGVNETEVDGIASKSVIEQTVGNSTVNDFNGRAQLERELQVTN